MAISSGTTSMIVLISHPRPILIPASRSQTGQKSVPLNHSPAGQTVEIVVEKPGVVRVLDDGPGIKDDSRVSGATDAENPPAGYTASSPTSKSGP